MNVSHILQNKGGGVLTCLADQSLLDVVDVLAIKGVGALVVVDANGSLIGMISERDVVRAISRHGGNVLDRRVIDFMSRRVVTASLTEGVDDVLAKMSAGRFRHLPVVESDLLVGIVSSGDAIKHRLDLLEMEVSSYQDYIATA